MTTYDERTEPENPRHAKIWKLLVCRLDKFTLRVDADTLVAVVKGEEFRLASEPDAVSAFVRRKWGGNVRRPSDCGAATLAKMSSEWMTSEQVRVALRMMAAATIKRLVTLHRQGRVERRKVGRVVEWRRIPAALVKRDRRGYNGYLYPSLKFQRHLDTYCERYGTSRRKALGIAINTAIDRAELEARLARGVL